MRSSLGSTNLGDAVVESREGKDDHEPTSSEAKSRESKIRHAAVRLLARREHSAAELTRKLVAKHQDRDLVGKIVAELQDQGLQSDARFTEAYVRGRTAKGYGPMQIRQGLFERGIDNDLVEAELTQSGEYWLGEAERLLARRFSRGIDPPDTEAELDRAEWNRRARFLARRGFPADLIYRALGR